MLLARYFGSTFFAVGVGFGVDWRILLVERARRPARAAAGGAARRSGARSRVPVREALEASGSAVGGQDAGDRLLRRVRFLPRTAQIGLRNVGRRRRRSIATGARDRASRSGPCSRVLGFAAGVSNASRTSWGDHGEDVKIDRAGPPAPRRARGSG